MTAPKEKVSLAKVAAIMAVVFMVSLGLCGLNAAVLGFKGGGGFLVVTAVLELAGMAGSLLGLVIVGLIAIIKAVLNQYSTKSSDSVSIIEKDEDK